MVVLDSFRPTPFSPPVLLTEGEISAMSLKSALAGSESSMNERDTIEAGCVSLSEAVTGAIWFALVPVTRISEPSAMPLSVTGGGASVARAA